MLVFQCLVHTIPALKIGLVTGSSDQSQVRPTTLGHFSHLSTSVLAERKFAGTGERAANVSDRGCCMCKYLGTVGFPGSYDASKEGNRKP